MCCLTVAGLAKWSTCLSLEGTNAVNIPESGGVVVEFKHFSARKFQAAATRETAALNEAMQMQSVENSMQLLDIDPKIFDTMTHDEWDKYVADQFKKKSLNVHPVGYYQKLSRARETLAASILETLNTTYGKYAIYPGHTASMRQAYCLDRCAACCGECEEPGKNKGHRKSPPCPFIGRKFFGIKTYLYENNVFSNVF